MLVFQSVEKVAKKFPQRIFLKPWKIELFHSYKNILTDKFCNELLLATSNTDLTSASNSDFLHPFDHIQGTLRLNVPKWHKKRKTPFINVF
jgi:hypothetical protein